MSEFDLLIGTRNTGKIREIRNAFRGLPLRLHLLTEFPHVSTPTESGATYEENAIIKAQAYSQQTALATLADDSGLEVDQLNGEPGVLSARYAGDRASDEERVRLLLSKLSAGNGSEISARFVCVMVIADSRVLKTAKGICKGRIASGPRGQNGFGFDPVFIPAGYTLTFAELPEEVKNSISHRARALGRIKQFLSELLSTSSTRL